MVKLLTIVPEGLANEKKDKETKVSNSSRGHKWECQGRVWKVHSQGYGQTIDHCPWVTC